MSGGGESGPGGFGGLFDPSGKGGYGGFGIGPGSTWYTDPIGFAVGHMSGGGGGQDYTASNLLAGITKQQWQNYQNIYQPIENKLISYATNPNVIKDAQAAAGLNADRAAASSEMGLNKALRGQGVQLTPDQQQAVSRKMGLQASLGKINAMNKAGQQTYDTVTNVLSGGAPNVSGLTQNVSQVL